MLISFLYFFGGRTVLHWFFLLVLVLLNWSKTILLAVESQPIAKDLLAGQLPLVNNLLYLVISQTQQHILGLEIGVDDIADSVEEIESHQNLPGDLLDKVEGKTLVIVPFEYFKKVDSKDFEDHAEVVAVGPLVEERVEEVEYMAVISVVFLLLGFVLFE